MLVFVSYSRADQEFALRLVDALHSWGHSTWIDIQNIPKGADWPDEIDKGLAAANVVVGVLSENSMASGNVKNEWDWALVHKKPLIPVRLHPCEVSHRYVRINYIDCVDNERVGLDALQKAIQAPTTSYSDGTPSVAIRQSAQGIESAKQRVTNRVTMLQKVHAFWIKGVLEPAKLGDVWLDLPAEQRPDVVEPEIKRELHNPAFDVFSLSSERRILDVFRRVGNELLILGAPGSGKTITLLELARDLIVTAQQDDSQPIPVVLNLASWAEKHPEKWEDWLVDRLFSDYGVSRKLGQLWIDNGSILFMFDGLDEVTANFRDACVTAINVFWHRYDQIDNGIAICSRTAEYTSLTASLHLENAIMLKPLTTAQADNYLARLGASWFDLRAVIPEDSILAEFAKSPLLLNVMAVAYRDTPREQIIGLNEADQKQQIFDRYVARRLREETVASRYPSAKSRYYLSWLARKMIEHQVTIFQIEGLETDWLDTNQNGRQNVKFGFSVLFGVLFGILLSAMGGILSRTMGGTQFGILVGAMVGVFVGVLVGGRIGKVVAMLICVSVSGLVGGLFDGVVLVLLVGVLGVIFGSMSSEYIVIKERVNWSWAAASSFGRQGFTLLFGIGAMIGGGIGGETTDGLIAALVGGVFGVLFGVLVGGLIVSSVDKRAVPNGGIWRSLTNTLVYILGSSLFFGLFGVLVYRPVFGLFFGLLFGLFGALSYGGAAVIKHLILRQILYNAHVMPRNYAEFLDYCVSCHLMRRVGGGYIFRHLMLMEYFAGRNSLF